MEKTEQEIIDFYVDAVCITLDAVDKNEKVDFHEFVKQLNRAIECWYM